MSSAIAAVDIVGAHHHSGEFLSQVVRLVGRLGTAEHAELATRVRLQTGCDAVHRLIPRGGLEFPTDPNERLR